MVKKRVIPIGSQGTVGTSFKKFMTELRQSKKVTAGTVNEYVRIYSQHKELERQITQLKDFLRTTAEDRPLMLALSDSPYLLELIEFPKVYLDKDQMIENLAVAVYGRNYKRNKAFKTMQKHNTRKETEERWLPPKPNPNFSEPKL